MSTKTLVLICHLERIGPTYAAGWVDFALSLNCGFEGDAPGVTAVDASLLRTWLWKWQDISVAGIAAAGATPQLIDKTDANGTNFYVLKMPDGTLTATLAFTQALDSAFQGSLADLTNFTLNNAPEVKRGRSVPWHAFVGSASTWPGGLSEWMHTTVHLRVSTTVCNKFQELIAAPIFAANYPFKAVSAPIDPTTANAFNVIAGPPVRYEWTYDTADVPAMVARQAPCKITLDAGTDANINFLTLMPKGLTWPDPVADWTEDLENRLANLFDLPQLLLTVLRARGAKGWAFDPGFHELFIGSLRDTANAGLATAPDNSTLASWLYGQAQLPSPIDFAPLADPDMHPTYDEWTATLAAALKAVYKVPVYDEITIKNLHFDAYLAALERLRAQTTMPDTLEALLLPAWTAAYKLAANNLRLLTVAVSDTNLRARMLLGNLGTAWPLLTFANETDLRQKVSDAVTTYVNDRSDPNGNGKSPFGPLRPHPSVAPASATLAADVTTAAMALFDANVKVTFSAHKPAIRAEGLVIPTGALRSSASITDEATDSQRRIGGAGIFVKPDSDTEAWTMLNYAILADANGAALVKGAVPIPLKPHYRNSVSRAYEVYLNQPLATPEPDADSQNRTFADSGGGDTGQIFTLLNPYVTPGTPPFLESLVYGSAYRVWVHLLGKGGELPSVLTNTGAGKPELNLPWQLVPPLPDTFPKTEYHTLTFYRCNTIGPIRLTGTGTRTDLTWPSIPADVQTLCGSHVKVTNLIPDPVQTASNNDPLLLLVPPADPSWNRVSKSTFTFDVYPPIVDLDIWQRAIGFSKTTSDLWTFVDTQTRAGTFMLDDPAVDRLEIACQQVHPAKGTTWTLYHVPFPAHPAFDTTHPSVTAVQGRPLNFVCNAVALPVDTKVAKPVFKIDIAGSTVTISIPEGEVWSVRLRPRVSAGALAGFQSDLKLLLEADISTDAMYHGESRIAFEVATTWKAGDLTATADALHKGLSIATSATGDSIDISLTPASAFSTLLGRVNLLVQRWRWDGRPIFLSDGKDPGSGTYGFPFGTDESPADTDPRDAILFGSRDSSDHLEITRNVDFVAMPTLAQTLDRRNHATTTGALLYRFALRGHSRYEPLLSNPSLIDTRPTPLSQGKVERWRHWIVKCRLAKQLPRPTLRAILPLTSAAPGAPSTSLMPIFDDQWYRDDLAGLAESLEGEILQVTLPDSPYETRPQFGPDPIVALPDDPYGNATITLPEVIGPIGTTFDTNTEAALFVKSSFIQPPPTVTMLDADGKPIPVDLSWHFVQLRYRRNLLAAAVAGSVDLTSAASVWTEPVWVQLLPPSNLFRVKSDDIMTVPVTDLRFNAATGKVGRSSHPEDQILPTRSKPHDADQPQIFTLLALLTRVSPDAFGHVDRESFVKLYYADRIDPQPAPGPSDGVLRLRLIEVHHRLDATLPVATAKTSLADAIFTLIFPSDQSDVTMRIVRVSPPIDAIWS